MTLVSWVKVLTISYLQCASKRLAQVSLLPYKQKIIDEIQKTWYTPYVSVLFNTYPIFKRNFFYPEVDHTDGIGTKGFYHWKQGTFNAAVIDALAMNLNDLAMLKVNPYSLTDNIMLPEEDNEAILEIVGSLVSESMVREIAILGGETAIHKNMSGLEISISMNGFVRNPKPNKCESGDVLVGMKSHGLHSNGFTKIREIFVDEIRPCTRVAEHENPADGRLCCALCTTGPCPENYRKRFAFQKIVPIGANVLDIQRKSRAYSRKCETPVLIYDNPGHIVLLS